MQQIKRAAHQRLIRLVLAAAAIGLLFGAAFTVNAHADGFADFDPPGVISVLR